MRDCSNTLSWERSLLILTMAICLIALVIPVYAKKVSGSSGSTPAVASSPQPGAVADQGKTASLLEKELDLGRGDGLLAKCPRSGGGSSRSGGGGRGGWSGGGFSTGTSFGGGFRGPGGITLSDDGSKKIEETFKVIDGLTTTSPGSGGSSSTGTRQIKSEKSEPAPSAKDLLDGSSPITSVAEPKPEDDLLGVDKELFCE